MKSTVRLLEVATLLCRTPPSIKFWVGSEMGIFIKKRDEKLSEFELELKLWKNALLKSKVVELHTKLSIYSR